MEKRLVIEMETQRNVTTSEGKEVSVPFRLFVPYGIPFDLAQNVLEEFSKELRDTAEKAAEKKVESSQEEPK